MCQISSDKIDNINNEMNIMKNIILTFSNKSKKENDISFGNKSSLGDLENISLADNANINEELYNNALNISNKKNNNNINKQMKRKKFWLKIQLKKIIKRKLILPIFICYLV